MYDKYASQGFAMVAINVDPSQDSLLAAWKKKGRYTFPVLLSPSPDYARTTYSVSGTPTNLLTDSTRKVMFRTAGYADGGDEMLEAEVRDLLGLNPFDTTRTAATGGQQAEVKSATVSLVPRPASSITLTIENLRDSPMIAWEVELLASAESPRALSTTGSDSLWIPRSSGSGYGPVQPHEQRTTQIPFTSSRGEAITAARVIVAVFEDGYAEGTPAAISNLTKSWQERAGELAWWNGVFARMPRSSDQEAREYLISKRIERAPFPDSVGLRGHLNGVLQGNRPNGWLFTVVDREFVAGVKTQLAIATRFLDREASTTAPAFVRSVASNVASQPGTDYTMRIENLSDKRIEAWGVEDVPSGGRAGGLQTTDAGADSTGRRGLQPHDVREEPFGRYRVAPGEPPPVVKMAFIVFDDLTYEGSPQEVRHLLQQREQRAEVLGFWIQALKEASTLPVDQLKTFLTAKEAEIARRATAENLPFGQGEIRDVFANLERMPERFPGMLQSKIRLMEESRAALLRHREGK